MNRRQFLMTATGLTVAAGAGMLWLNPDRPHPELDIERAFLKLATLSGRELRSSGIWTPFQILSHCAQSIEYSMTGYPQHRSDLFKNTVGSLAFMAFSSAGKMRHNLAEAIPGAEFLPAHGDVQAALRRVQDALEAFRGYTGELQPHFAYGTLSKEEYGRAHVMHLNNHFLELSV